MVSCYLLSDEIPSFTQIIIALDFEIPICRFADCVNGRQSPICKGSTHHGPGVYGAVVMVSALPSGKMGIDRNKPVLKAASPAEFLEVDAAVTELAKLDARQAVVR